MDPNQVLIVTTGSQGEPLAQLSKAAMEESKMLKIMPNVRRVEWRAEWRVKDSGCRGGDVAVGT